MKGTSAEFYLNSRKKGVYACALVAVSDYTTQPKFSKNYKDPQQWVSSCGGGASLAFGCKHHSNATSEALGLV